MELEDVNNQRRQDGDSAGTRDDTETGRTLPPDLMVVRDHQTREHVVPVARFFGSAWDEIIKQSHGAELPDLTPLHLAITLRSDQQNGIRRLLHLLDTPFKGAIVGHAIGCGRMTQAIIASRLDSNRAGKFTLVITNSYQLEQCKTDIEEMFEPSRTLVQAIGGQPFTTSEEFHRVFGRAQNGHSDTQRQYLTRLLMALVIASPSSVLPLPPLTVHTVRFSLPQEQEIQAAFVIIRYYRCLRVRLQQEGVSGKLADIINETDEKDTASDIKMIATAQSLAGHLAQVDPTQVDHEEMKVSVESFLSQCRTALNLPPDQLPGYKQCKDWLAKVVRGSNIYDDLLPDSARNTAEAYDNKTPKSVKDTQSDDRWRVRLNAIDSGTLNEGRIGRTLDILRDLRDHTAGNLVDFSRYGVTGPVPTHHDKILIAGRYERFLIILARAIRNFLPDTRLIIYDSVSEKTRATDRRAFSSSRAEQTVMLITGNTHGANLKLTDATAVIQTEPWLVHDGEIEAWSRCHRTGQSREVTVFQLMAENSLVDMFVADAMDEKDKKLQQYMRHLRPDGTPLDALLGELRG
ncbi:hypothetical protein KVT40_008675 [Elsinoe batatas]|uniref:Helicase C-terminal domain-containing protein n=1 Tax=Elsinoe batatas TaxID=2601811 RepID=A0A8K0PFM3_9PEZI|nr:hypothetical protein KVT40_008675 [Elsinoe batatas]